MEFLEVKKVVSGYGRIPVLHEVSFNVKKGELIAIIGPNGAGKSTLMSTVSGHVSTMGGEIHFNGKPIHGLKASRIAQMGIGYVPQRGNVFAELTVNENLNMGAYSLKKPKQAIDEVVELFPALKSRMKQYAGTLSGGERQMLALASALIVKPQLLLLDEPITGLAPQIIENLVKQIVTIRSQGTTIVWIVEENPRQVLPHADRVYLMDSGQIESQYTGAELMNHEDFSALFMGVS